MNSKKFYININLFLITAIFLPLSSVPEKKKPTPTLNTNNHKFAYGTTGLLLLTTIGIGLKTKKSGLAMVARQFPFFSRQNPLTNKFTNVITPRQFETYQEENRIFQEKISLQIADFNKKLTNLQTETAFQNRDTYVRIQDLKEEIINIKKDNL